MDQSREGNAPSKVQASAAWRGVSLVIIGLVSVVLLSRESGLGTRLFQAAAETELFVAGRYLSEAALLALVGFWAVSAIVLLFRRDAPSTARLGAGGFGSVLAYASSELLKTLFARVRPCHSLDVAASCPSPENWSYPSNHTVIAFSLMVAVVAAVPRLWILVVPLALLAGVSRVFAGHHYPQDVLGGAVLGLCAAAACVLVFAPLVHRMLVLPVLRRKRNSAVTADDEVLDRLPQV